MLVKINSKFIKNKYFWFFLFSILFSLMSVMDLRAKLFNYNIFSYEKQIFIGIISICLSLLIFTLLFFLEKYDIKIEKVFLILALTLGLIYILASPLFTGNDEHNHYYRIYEIVDGTLITPIQYDGTIGSQLPKSLCSMLVGGEINKTSLNFCHNIHIEYMDELRMLNVELNPNETMQYGEYWSSQYVNTALYNPIQYLPEVLGFSFGKLFNVTPFIIGELGRLFNLLFFVGLGYIFLNKMPYMKEYLVLILLTPTVLSGATTLSADAFANILIFGLLSYVLYYIDTRSQVNTKDMLILMLLSIGISSCKIVYFPFAFLLFLIPVGSYKSKICKYLNSGLILLVSGIISFYWLEIINQYLDVFFINSQIQKIHIIQNIWGYGVIVFKTYFFNFLSLLLNVFGSNDLYFAQLNVYSFLPIIYVYIIIIAIYISIKNREKKLEKYSYYMSVLFLIVVELILIITAIYVQYTSNYIKLDNPLVIGLQGRYYVPLMFLIPFFIKSKDQKINYSILGFALLVNIGILMQMVVHFI